jgi:hypothetical protein
MPRIRMEAETVQMDVFLTSALIGGKRLASSPCRLTPRAKATGNLWGGGWVDPTAGLDGMENVTFLKLFQITKKELR